jgi:DNA-binding LacI/PurR family transcriptional regulator
MRDHMFRGDHALFDAVRDTLGEEGANLASLTLRCLPPDLMAVKANVAEVLQQSASAERVGFICRSEPLAIGAEAAADSLGMAVGRDVGIVLSDAYRKGSDSPPRWPHLKPALSPEEIGKHIGRMLAQQATGAAVQPDHEIIPVYLESPQPQPSTT